MGKVIANGFPKAGNHALVKALQLLGQPCEVNHIPYAEKAEGKYILIKRHPANIICSWLRANGKPVTPGMFIAALKEFRSGPLVDELGEYEGWLSDPDTFVVSYEDIISSENTMREIAAYLELPYIQGAFEDLPGLTTTWFADHSDYSLVWTPEVAEAWEVARGSQLAERWGYV